jgi:hypothetical protein
MGARAQPAPNCRITFLAKERESSRTPFKTSWIFTFQISYDYLTTRGLVVLTDTGVEMIERSGRDPIDAARVALRQTVTSLPAPLGKPILLRVPIEYAECFSQNGHFDGLPRLID